LAFGDKASLPDRRLRMRLTTCVITVTLLAISSGIGQEPKKDDKTKADPITKEWLVGRWKHLKDAGVTTISFGKDGQGEHTTVWSGIDRPNETIHRSIPFDYVIDAKANVVKIVAKKEPEEKDRTLIGTAKRIADDKLRVTIKWIDNKVDFERIKEEKPEK
jgi:hypothetical protein